MMKRPLTTLLTALSLTAPLLGEEEVLVPRAQGIILTSDMQIPPLQVEGIAIVDLELPGSRHSLEERLAPLFMGKALTAEDITEIKREIVRYYRDHNRSVVAVQVPEQDVTSGVVTFLITEGRVGEVKVENNRYFSKRLICDYIQLEPGEVIDDSVLLNNLAFINRNPFRHVDLVYSPGKEIGSTDLEIYVQDHFPLRVYAGVDNTGLEATDRLRLYTGFNWGNAFGLDSIMSFQYTTAPDLDKFQGYTLSFTSLLPWQNVLLLYGGYSETHVKLQKNQRHPKAHGHSAQASVRYGIPVKPKPHILHEFNAGYDFKYTNNSFEFAEQQPRIGHDVNLTQFVFTYNFGYERGRQKAGFDVQLFASPFTWLPNQSTEDFQTLNPHAAPRYAYAQLAVDYAAKVLYNCLLKLFFEGQVATDSLLPSEQFGLGGYDTVRGYNQRQVNSDDGILFSAELWSPTFNPSFGLMKDVLQFLLFFDYGLGHDIHKIAKIKQTQHLAGMGPGLRYSIHSNLSCRLDYGFKLYRDDYEGGIGMAHFSVIGSY